MNIKLQKKDVVFLVVLSISLISVFRILFLYPITDETFYVSTALRIIDGDSLISDEWHMTQFSSLFNILPVFLFVKISGSTQGIVLYMRLVYFVLYYLFGVFLYRSFRQKGIVAAIAVMLFLVPCYMFTLSYHTVYCLSLFAFSVFLYFAFIYRNCKFFIVVGILYGCCCVCNPLVCIAFPVYLFFYLFFWKKLKKREKNRSSENRYFYCELLFSKKAILLIFSGIAIMAGISIFFYVITGGRFDNIFGNLKMMFDVSEYSANLLQRVKNIYYVYKQLSFNMPYLLPVLWFCLILDRKRSNSYHKIIYLVFAFVLFVLYVVRILTCYDHGLFSVFLPITMFSHICYVLTAKRDKQLFVAIWLPGVIGASVQLFSSRSTFMVFGGVVLPAAFSGIFFIADFVSELVNDIKALKIRKEKKYNSLVKLISVFLSVSIVFLQFVFQIHVASDFYKFFGVPSVDYSNGIFVTSGPLKGTFMLKDYYSDYVNKLKDLNYIFQHSEENDPVLIFSYYPWLYLHLDRPIASYSAWGEIVDVQSLYQYYTMNREKIPKYIYIENSNSAKVREMSLKELFSFESIELTDGILLCVEDMLFFQE